MLLPLFQKCYLEDGVVFSFAQTVFGFVDISMHNKMSQCWDSKPQRVNEKYDGVGRSVKHDI